MPSPEKILESLTLISNEARLMALIWHVLLGIFIVMLLFGWRPSKRFVAICLALPLVTVSIFAWLYGNPFNGITFLLFAFLMIFFGWRLPSRRIEYESLPLSLIGVVMIAFGWIYPHFLGDASLLIYAYAAPVGLVPCPTLSIVIGFALLLSGLSSRNWSLVLAIAGVFYGLFGAIRLQVYIDIVLLVGSVILLARLIMKWSRFKPA